MQFFNFMVPTRS